MEIVFEHELHPDLKALEWLVGTWEGDGVGDYPTIERFRFTQQVSFTHIGKPYLIYTSRTWRLDEEFKQREALAYETGFWRVPGGGREIEVLLSHPTGVQEIYTGEVAFHKVELVTDVVARTRTAKEVTGGKRLYGLFPAQEGTEERDLGWVYEMAALGHPLQVHMSAQLKKVLPE
ncbi:FABP family protein [Actinocorallia sp. API 0066]|uniref:FABP family protein n=1 Tax=Actinocorallia sp. API 0066 TaxID=2896846 RepID=UPI001E4202E1|nr:FABP family protein [Actinocorallia sp. API 0066]MCD0450263.1 FABP family protein [Actinocorallia sp. API 0066]